MSHFRRDLDSEDTDSTSTSNLIRATCSIQNLLALLRPCTVYATAKFVLTVHLLLQRRTGMKLATVRYDKLHAVRASKPRLRQLYA